MRIEINNSLKVFISNLIAKGLTFAASIVVVRNLLEQDFAEWTYYRSFIFFLLPIAGLGMEQTFLRYSYIIDSRSSMEFKNKTYSVAVFSSLLFFVIFSLILPLIRPINFGDNILLVGTLLTLFTVQFNNFQLMVLRVEENFNKYSLVIILTAIFTSLALAIGSLLGVKIMSFSLAISFVLVFSIFQKNITLDWKNLKIKRDQLNYGISIGIGGILNKSVYVLDVIYLGNFFEDPSVLAGYKVATLIPFNLTLISNSILIVDFGEFVNYGRKEIFRYLFQYWLKLMVLLIPLGLTILLYNENIISFIFGANYASNGEIFLSYFLLITFILLFRAPAGTILNALGYAKLNTILAAIQTLGLLAIFIVPISLDPIRLICYLFLVTVVLTAIQYIWLWKR